MTLSWQGAYVVATPGVAAPRTRMTADGTAYHQPTSLEIADFTDSVIGAVAGSPYDRLLAVTDVVGRYGIGPQRFGEFR